jgi:hypothetical protein
MNTLSRWIASLTLAPLAVLTLQGVAMSAFALTDTNAELKAAAADRVDRVVVTGRAARPAQTAWVPVSVKRLEGFSPVLPPERREAMAPSRPAQTLAKAESR